MQDAFIILLIPTQREMPVFGILHDEIVVGIMVHWQIPSFRARTDKLGLLG